MKEEELLKIYKAIFFDWDGTAVLSRTAPADTAAAAMRPLLDRGVKLAVISGTTIENIAGGHIEEYFSEKQLGNLFLGLGRGAYNYGFESGKPCLLDGGTAVWDDETLLNIHRICFDIHLELKQSYHFDTDIVFSRPNYCKIDLMPESGRGDQLFMQADELLRLRDKLERHGIKGGLKGLTDFSVTVGKRYRIDVTPTCDAKYLEVGITSKSDNVDVILDKFCTENDIRPEECAYWGDEYVGIEEGIFGSDSFMHTEKTAGGDFFDVSEVKGERPEGVTVLGGGVERFLGFLREQGQR